ncbi:transglutaminase domain-containing protein [Sabulibacter ruber]|uniref:transglutaminase domain-containing protein n=1 Tax=Sabulibacter ruber TaxID=2811901 RepID=UPI001A960414|nr:transglutaminase domain-containing protein [Sabulibacter ruber]
MIKYILPLFIFLFLSSDSFSQIENYHNFYSVDQHALGTPKNHHKDVTGLTNYLIKPFDSDIEKARSIYSWIVANIRYDHALAKQKNRKRSSIKLILNKKRAVCLGYSDLYKAMCTIAGIECVVVPGYSRFYNFNAKRKERFTWSDHAWNAVKLTGKWHLLDATWERKEEEKNGKTIGQEYFLANPKSFVLDHLPENPTWQLLSCPISLNDFKTGTDELTKQLDNDAFCISFKDSIAALHKLHPALKELKEAQDAYHYNPDNHLSIGLGLYNYGSFLCNINSVNKEIDVDARKQGLSQGLTYYKESLKHLRKAKKPLIVLSCKKKINSTKKQLQRLEKKS